MSESKSMDRNRFVDAAKNVLDRLGAPYQNVMGKGVLYEDDVIRIVSFYNGLDLEITRKPMPEVASFLSGSNPVTMVKDGVVIRHHGEHAYLASHLADLEAGLAPAPRP